MKKVILQYGFLSIVFTCIFFSITVNFFDKQDMGLQEFFGYAGMFLSMLFAVVGIWHYREKVLDGSITLGRAFKIGLIIALFPSLFIGIGDVLYVKYVYPEFSTDYMEYMKNEMIEKGMPMEEVEVSIAQMQQDFEMFNNPYFQFFIMFITTFLIGLIVVAIASYVLAKKKKRA